MAKQFAVANPRKIPAGRHILAVRKRDVTTLFHEGDAITPKDAFTPEGWASWLAGGFVVEVKSGG